MSKAGAWKEALQAASDAHRLHVCRAYGSIKLGDMFMVRRSLFAGVACLAVVCALGAAPARADIQIASAGPMTGEYASFGQQLREGAEQAVADINAKGRMPV